MAIEELEIKDQLGYRYMTEADIKVIATALHEYARETIGDRADAE